MRLVVLATLLGVAALVALVATQVSAAPTPQVTITSGPPDRVVVRGNRTASLTWEFATDIPANTTCKFTGVQLRPCSSPRTYAGLAPGEYRFIVYSTNPRTDLGITSARQDVKVVRAKKRR